MFFHYLRILSKPMLIDTRTGTRTRTYTTVVIEWLLTWNRYRPLSFEPPHDKTNKMACAHSEKDRPGHPLNLIRVFAVRTKKAWVLSYPLSARRRLWSDWAGAQADLSLRWAHRHFVGFVVRRLVYARSPLNETLTNFRRRRRCMYLSRVCILWTKNPFISVKFIEIK